MIEISQRLYNIADLVQPGSKVADIGSDHAYLPLYLIQSGKAISAIAGEVNQGPWQSAKKTVAEAGLEDRIEVRRGDGLAVLDNGEVDTICIAGMGGTLISHILEAGLYRLSSVRHLVLQPNVAERNVREWLLEHGWELIEERILKEDGVIYEILAAIRGDAQAPYLGKRWSKEILLEIGPFQWENQSPILNEKWQEEYKKVEWVLNNLQQAQSSEAETKKQEMKRRLEWIREVLSCTQMDKP